MSVPGPVPKRASERLGHRAKADRPTEAPSATAEPIPTPLPNPNWHPMVKLWWDSVASSGMKVFYERSDWGMAYMFAEALDRELDEQKYLGMSKDGDKVHGKAPINPQMLTALLKLSTGMGLTEGDRRRMSIELQRESNEEQEEAKILALVRDDEKDAFGA